MACVDIALNCGTILGESPVSQPNGIVSFVDINGKAIHTFDSSNGSHSSMKMPEMVGCIVPHSQGGYLAAMETPIVKVDFLNKSIQGTVSSLPAEHRGPKIRFNDGKCDPEGRFWVGSMHSGWRDPDAPHGRLYTLDRSSRGAPNLVEKLSPTRLSNGMAWSSDNSHFYWIDSYYRTVWVFDYDAISGGICNKRISVKVPDSEPGPPDGMTIDSDGKLWIVIAESGTVKQYDPETGNLISYVDLPIQRPTSCVFGGKDLSELYVTSREEASPIAGALVRCRVPGIRGASFSDAFDQNDNRTTLLKI